jgi:glycosyltransferase involved in cell wall biosynthesis
VFVGEGAAKDGLVRQAKELQVLDRNVFFLPHQSVTVAKSLMRDADVTLVTLSPGVSSVAYPSKTLTLLALGCPLGVMMEWDCELSRMVRDNGLGFAVANGDSQGLADAICGLADSPGELNQIRDRVAAYGAKHAVAEAVFPAWSKLIRQLVTSHA